MQSRGMERVVRALKKITKEIRKVSTARWTDRLQPKVGAVVSLQRQQEPAQHASLGWLPRKPRTAALLLEAFSQSEATTLEDGLPLIITAPLSLAPYAGGCKQKLVARRAVEWVVKHRSTELASCGELTSDQLADPNKLLKVLARSAADLLAQIHSRALHLGRCAGLEPGQPFALIELHRTTGSLCGKTSRGAGLVFDSKGRVLFSNALNSVAAQLLQQDHTAQTHTSTGSLLDGGRGSLENIATQPHTSTPGWLEGQD